MGAGPPIPLIAAILEADRNARADRHTAHGIRQRILTELPERSVAEVTLRQSCASAKQELGWVSLHDLRAAELRASSPSMCARVAARRPVSGLSFLQEVCRIQRVSITVNFLSR